MAHRKSGRQSLPVFFSDFNVAWFHLQALSQETFGNAYFGQIGLSFILEHVMYLRYLNLAKRYVYNYNIIVHRRSVAFSSKVQYRIANFKGNWWWELSSTSCALQRVPSFFCALSDGKKIRPCMYFLISEACALSFRYLVRGAIFCRFVWSMPPLDRVSLWTASDDIRSIYTIVGSDFIT